jgi:predicted Zn-dependent peptidase
MLSLFVLVTFASAQIPIETRVLDNGLRVVLSEDHHAPTVSVAVAYDAGSRNEDEGETGLAHLVEHMMFRGSENVGSGEHYVRVASGGSPPTARTTLEATIYVQTVTRNHLEAVLFLEADRMRALRPTPESIAQERDRIRSEREAELNQPYGSVDAVVFRESFDSFGYKYTPLGQPGDLEGIGLEEVHAFHRAYYAPGNAVLAIVGDFDTEAATALVDDYFGSIPPRPLPPTKSFVEVPRDAEARVSMADRAAAYPRIDVAYRVPAGGLPQWYRLALLAEVFGGQGGRLQALVDGGAAIDAIATIDEQRVGSLFRISLDHQHVGLPIGTPTGSGDRVLSANERFFGLRRARHRRSVGYEEPQVTALAGGERLS